MWIIRAWARFLLYMFFNIELRCHTNTWFCCVFIKITWYPYTDVRLGQLWDIFGVLLHLSSASRSWSVIYWINLSVNCAKVFSQLHDARVDLHQSYHRTKSGLREFSWNIDISMEMDGGISCQWRPSYNAIALVYYVAWYQRIAWLCITNPCLCTPSSSY